MKHPIAVAAVFVSLVAVVASAAPPPGGFEEEGSRSPGLSSDAPAGFPADVQRPELRVLLSSIDMTISLIDAYGQCRDEGKTHEQCMSIIRETLDHARSMIGR